MRRLYEHKLAVFLITATIVLGIIIAVFASRDRDTSVIESVGGAVVTPAQSTVSETGGFFSKLFGYFGNVEKLKDENALLKNENTNLQKHIKDMERFEKENEKLRKMLDLREKQTKIDMVAASVVAKDPSNWYSTFTINRGEKNGIKRNQAVVNSNRELIGQILRTGDNWAEVITILDSQFSAGIEIKRSNEIGILEGDANLRYSGLCRLGYIARDTDVVEGDFVETSGLGGVFPKGLLIGTVTEVYEENATMSKAAKIEPLADIAKVKDLFVITHYEEADLTDDMLDDDEDVEEDNSENDDEESNEE